MIFENSYRRFFDSFHAARIFIYFFKIISFALEVYATRHLLNRIHIFEILSLISMFYAEFIVKESLAKIDEKMRLIL